MRAKVLTAGRGRGSGQSSGGGGSGGGRGRGRGGGGGASRADSSEGAKEEAKELAAGNGKPDYLQVRLDRKTAKTNLIKEFEGADYDPARWVSDGLALKQRIAARATRPQIIVLAGSNALYGFSAERLEARLGVPATNAPPLLMELTSVPASQIMLPVKYCGRNPLSDRFISPTAMRKNT